ncbi:hypothetical protein FHS10_004105 [Mucilaginibacter dorajii]|nr:hypothetical protein [Mucilaginibacter dorajii]
MTTSDLIADKIKKPPLCLKVLAVYYACNKDFMVLCFDIIRQHGNGEVFDVDAVIL